MRTFALIPAAGQSRRMGEPKLLLPLGDKTVLEHVLAALREAGVAQLLVVVGPEGERLEAVAATAGARVLRLREQTEDMRATCVQGLAWLEANCGPGPDDGWLLVPADHPTLSGELVRAVLGAAAGAEVVVPVFQGKRGHPVWLRWRQVAAIRQLAAGQGLNQVIRQLAGQTQEVEWRDAEVLRDLDTPEDYRQLLAERGAKR